MTEDQPCALSEKARKRRERRAQRSTAPGNTGFPGGRLVPRNENQADLLAALSQHPVVFAIGPEGTGKTYIPARWAMQRLLTPSANISRIVVTRPTEAPKRHRLGFQPGNEKAKMKNWLIPIMDGFKAETSAANIEKLMLNGSIEIVPFEFMRGRSFDDSIVLLDEGQNCIFSDLKLIITRAGENTTTIITGDPYQDDLKDQGIESGLVPVWRMVEKYGLDAGRIAFSVDDVVRSGPTAAWVKAFHQELGYSHGVRGYNF